MYAERPTNSIASVEADFCWRNCKQFSSVNFSSIDCISDSWSLFIIPGPWVLTVNSPTTYTHQTVSLSFIKGNNLLEMVLDAIKMTACVRVLLCVSCVPASCVHIWFVSCPRLMSLWVNSCPAVFVSLSVINLCILVHACSVWFRLVYSLLPVFPVCQPCLVLIKECYLSLRLRVPVSSLLCAPWQHELAGCH